MNKSVIFDVDGVVLNQYPLTLISFIVILFFLQMNITEELLMLFTKLTQTIPPFIKLNYIYEYYFYYEL